MLIGCELRQVPWKLFLRFLRRPRRIQTFGPQLFVQRPVFCLFSWGGAWKKRWAVKLQGSVVSQDWASIPWACVQTLGRWRGKPGVMHASISPKIGDVWHLQIQRQLNTSKHHHWLVVWNTCVFHPFRDVFFPPKLTSINIFVNRFDSNHQSVKACRNMLASGNKSILTRYATIVCDSNSSDNFLTDPAVSRMTCGAETDLQHDDMGHDTELCMLWCLHKPTCATCVFCWNLCEAYQIIGVTMATVPHF